MFHFHYFWLLRNFCSGLKPVTIVKPKHFFVWNMSKPFFLSVKRTGTFAGIHITNCTHTKSGRNDKQKSLLMCKHSSIIGGECVLEESSGCMFKDHRCFIRCICKTLKQSQEICVDTLRGKKRMTILRRWFPIYERVGSTDTEDWSTSKAHEAHVCSQANLQGRISICGWGCKTYGYCLWYCGFRILASRKDLGMVAFFPPRLERREETWVNLWWGKGTD